MIPAPLDERRHPDSTDSRTPFERDRDRVLYTSALRRLAETSQVLPASAGHVYHNRLTHTLEVAQLARRIAERHETGADPAACEAAAWAHDLGHPPFGHTGEAELDRVLLERWPEGDGYEGNAQSFRIVTRLAVRREGCPGLNLTRGSLRGILKYPWLRTSRPEAKFGAYRTEAEELRWAVLGLKPGEPAIEAQVVEFADDVAYSVHDLFDFIRAGLIPMDRLQQGGDEWESFASAVPATMDGSALAEVFQEWVRPYPLRAPFDGSSTDRALLRTYTGGMIHRFVEGGTTPEPGRLEINASAKAALIALKHLALHYVMMHPGLEAVKVEQRALVARLTHWLAEDEGRHLGIEAREQLETGQPLDRAVADAVAGLTESEAERLASVI
ncbi:MAG: dNTP triphosphohydrolase [Fimbriimonadaceae bacterium]|nr:dNTP triphosphohydrolase [Fimbriimonadaceae bacterium]